MAYVDSYRRLEKLLDKHEPALKRQFLRHVRTIRDAGTLDALAELISRGRANDAFATIQSASGAFFADFANVFSDSATSTAAVLTDALRRPIGYNPVDPFTQQVLRSDSVRITHGMFNEQRRAIQATLIDGFERGVNPKEQARALRDVVGLTEGQARTVNRYRRLLESASSEALRRDLRDRRFDSTVRRAVESGIPPSAEQIDKMVAAYARRMLDFRATTIARTEALRGVNEGVNAMYAQAIRNGDLDPSEIERTWVTAGDERVRGSHKTMNGQTRGMREPFTSGAGASLMFPGDPSASAAETVRCRCTLTTVLNVGDE